jgi:two-component system LytT family response regulator
MTRFRVLVADDEPLALGMVATLLRDDEEVDDVLECGYAKAARALSAAHHPDIVFLDIEMPEVTGLDLAEDLSDGGPIVVFVTAFSRYATDAFEVDASDYVLKPFTDERFAEALQRAKRRVRERRSGELANQLASLSSELRLAEGELSKSAESGDGGYLKRLAFAQRSHHRAQDDGHRLDRGRGLLRPRPLETGVPSGSRVARVAGGAARPAEFPARPPRRAGERQRSARIAGCRRAGAPARMAPRFR